MPYIGVNISKPLSQAQKDAIKTGFGEAVTLIPGKSEPALMVEIADGRTIYMGGQACETAYIDVKIYGETDFASKKAFTEAAFAVVSKAAGIGADAMYLTFEQYENWGTRGTMK